MMNSRLLRRKKISKKSKRRPRSELKLSVHSKLRTKRNSGRRTQATVDTCNAHGAMTREALHRGANLTPTPDATMTTIARPMSTLMKKENVKMKYLKALRSIPEEVAIEMAMNREERDVTGEMIKSLSIMSY